MTREKFFDRLEEKIQAEKEPQILREIAMELLAMLEREMNKVEKQTDPREEKAAAAYGPDFIPAAKKAAGELAIPLPWLLWVLAWETTQFRAKGPPWPVNKHDGGGGLIGWTPLSKYPEIAAKDAAGQLPYVVAYYKRWMKKLGLQQLGSLGDVYLIVRAPYAIGKPDNFDCGGGLTKGEILAIVAKNP